MAAGKQNVTNNFGEQSTQYLKGIRVPNKTGKPDILLASGAGIFSGTGVPTITAPPGSLYLRTDGATNSLVLYVTFDGTTWAAK